MDEKVYKVNRKDLYWVESPEAKSCAKHWQQRLLPKRETVETFSHTSGSYKQGGTNQVTFPIIWGRHYKGMGTTKARASMAIIYVKGSY